MPQKLAVPRPDPPVSVPSAMSQIPPATAAADPADEPPGTRPGACGFVGVPSNGFSPNMPSETSSVIVLPIKSAPASSSVCTAQACRSGSGWVLAQSGLPPPVGRPATSNRSLAAKVRPESAPPSRPVIRNIWPGTKAPRSSPMSLIVSPQLLARTALAATSAQDQGRPAVDREPSRHGKPLHPVRREHHRLLAAQLPGEDGNAARRKRARQIARHQAQRTRQDVGQDQVVM